jgi:hypothetical protein
MRAINLKRAELKMTRLEALCKLHKMQGGTIHYFNRLYGIDFNTTEDADIFTRSRELMTLGKYDLAKDITRIPILTAGLTVVITNKGN